MRMRGLSVLALVASAHAQAATVTVNVTGVRVNAGKVIISLCTKKQFMATHCSYVTDVPARTAGVSVDFNGVSAGRYMAAAFQDLDGDGELKFTFTGPGEPAGVSGPQRRIPDFDKALFEVGAEPKTVSVTLR